MDDGAGDGKTWGNNAHKSSTDNDSKTADILPLTNLFVILIVAPTSRSRPLEGPRSCWKSAPQLVKCQTESPRKSKKLMSVPNGNHPTMYHRQPLGYGPAASPRQDLFTQEPYQTWPEARMHLARIVYSTERAAIEGILPPGFHVQQGAEPTIMFEVLVLFRLSKPGYESQQSTLAGGSGI